MDVKKVLFIAAVAVAAMAVVYRVDAARKLVTDKP